MCEILGNLFGSFLGLASRRPAAARPRRAALRVDPLEERMALSTAMPVDSAALNYGPSECAVATTARTADHGHGTHVAGTIGAVGNNNASVGETGTHEVGHWMGLYHEHTRNAPVGDTGTHEVGHWMGLYHSHASARDDMELKGKSIGANASSAPAADAAFADEGGDSDGSIAVGGYIRIKKLHSGG